MMVLVAKVVAIDTSVYLTGIDSSRGFLNISKTPNAIK